MGAHALSSALRGGRAVSVLMLDLDHFKEVNDRHGHAAGDRLLREVAETISKCLRECDVFGRYGGEEFCAVLPDTASTGALLIATRICNSIGSRVYYLGNATGTITASIGVATATSDPSQTIADLIEQADAAMYRAKRGGRNRIETVSRPALLSSAAGN
jgi:diguanylate cyclase (GGDEF)-like protein